MPKEYKPIPTKEPTEEEFEVLWEKFISDPRFPNLKKFDADFKKIFGEGVKKEK